MTHPQIHVHVVTHHPVLTPCRPDAECIKILQAIRSSVDRTAAANNGNSSSRRVRLLIVEVTTAEEVLPCHLPFR
jgi:hypothetical protein